MIAAATKSSDRDLLRRFVRERSQEAFAELVDRHLDMIYRVALRETAGRAAMADDVAQAVFIVLAEKAPALLDVRSLAGWLHNVARCAAIDALRKERRRHKYEHAAAHENGRRRAKAAAPIFPAENALDTALARLTSADREALLLRFYHAASFAQIGIALDITEEAARKRTARALGRLKQLLLLAGAAGAWTAFLSEKACAAPVPLTHEFSARITRNIRPPASAWAVNPPHNLLAKGVLNMMRSQRIKLAAAAAVIAAAIGVIWTVESNGSARDSQRLALRHADAATPPAIPAAPAANPSETAQSYQFRAPTAAHGAPANSFSWIAAGDGQDAHPDAPPQALQITQALSAAGAPNTTQGANGTASAQFVLVFKGPPHADGAPDDAAHLYDEQDAPAATAADPQVKQIWIQSISGSITGAAGATGSGNVSITVDPPADGGTLITRIAVPPGGKPVLVASGNGDPASVTSAPIEITGGPGFITLQTQAPDGLTTLQATELKMVFPADITVLPADATQLPTWIQSLINAARSNLPALPPTSMIQEKN